MDIKRKAYIKLLEWKEKEQRKPLLLRGARQVGKTTLIRAFASEFTNYIELNLEREKEWNLFLHDDINKIFNAACLLKEIVPDQGPTLLFIDEIQESPQAIKLLRYFFEDMPGLYVVAAGSLLEFALKDVTGFPVGRIEYLYLHPVSFEEYLGAIGNSLAKDALDSIPVQDYAHDILLNLFHTYTIIGGMPEVLNNYIIDQNIAGLSVTYKRLWQAYKDDVEKYARNEKDRKVIRHVVETAPFESDRIKFERFGKSSYRSREVGEALRALDHAKVIQLIYPTTSVSPPIITDMKKRPRLQFLDTGMLNQILLIQGEMLSAKDLNDFHRGKIIQHLVYQELISISEDLPFKPHFWVREEKDSNAEVDMVYQVGKYIVPIEVKSGKKGRLRSLHQFVERSDHPYAVRLYEGTFSVESAKTPGGEDYLLMNLPYYLACRLPEYLNWFVQEH
ncbi:MAG: AAA family ATPase [Cyclobacteriaceae bacterium]|nr:AAA family ATPase [Cyclobacteriaceae bacterium]